MNSDLETVEPLVEQQRAISKIWLLPLLAALVGLAMIYSQWHNRGVNIQISFDTAEALEVGKTKLKYRNVEIGEVSEITFNSDLSKILVGVEIKKPMVKLVVDDTLFWVVKPRVDAAGITGFGTLMSGAYIEIAPGRSENLQTEFVGLELPPATPPSVLGLRLTLTSKGGKSLAVGNPILHKGFKVGQIEQFEFNVNTGTANYEIFIKAPYDALVNSKTNFWNVSGASLQTSAAGISVDIGSLETLVSGGVEFGVPEGTSNGERAQQNQSFELYDSQNRILEGKRYDYLKYVVLANESIGGLNKGAPVEFRGIRIGTVESAKVEFNEITKITKNSTDGRIPIVVHIEPERVSGQQERSMQDYQEQFDQWILSGLTARIEPANFLTGTLKMTLEADGEPISELPLSGPNTIIPWEPSEIASFTEKLESILTKLDDLPLDVTVNRVNTVLASADQTLLSLDSTLTSVEATATSLRPQAELFISVQDAVDELKTTLQTSKPLIQQITNKPSSLIFSGTKPADIEPKAKK